MKTSTQLKALIRNLSKEKQVEAEVILRNFMFERLLERIALSAYKDNFILKGGMLIAAMVGIDTRTTMDLDATIKAKNLSEAEIATIITDILEVPIDDGVAFSFRDIQEIHEESDYPGYRVAINALFDKTKQTLKVDITTGDYVTPKEIEYSFKLMFEDRVINIMAYNLETVLAEKFETTITRGVANTRMRDFYDIYILTTTHSFDSAIFSAALRKTTEKRNTVEQMAGPEKIIHSIASDSDMAELWVRYQKKYRYAEGITWEVVLKALNELARQVDENGDAR